MKKIKTLALLFFAAMMGTANATDNLPATVGTTPVAQTSVPATQTTTLPATPTGSAVGTSIAYTVDNLPITSTFGANKFVCNPDGILSPATVDSINKMMQLLEEDTKYQVLFVAVNRVEPADLNTFATNLGNKLGVGDSSTNSGLVVVFSRELREVYVKPGLGTAKLMTESKCKNLLDRYFVPSFRENNWDAGMLKGAAGINEFLRTERGSSAGSSSSSNGIMGFLASLGIMGLIGYFVAKKAGKKCPKCGKKLKFAGKEYFKGENGKEMMRFTYKCTNCDYVEVKEEERLKDFGKGKFENNSGAGSKF